MEKSNRSENKKTASPTLQLGRITLGMPHILMGVSILLSQALLPLVSSLTYNIVTHFGEEVNWLFSDILDILLSVAALAIFVACGYFAYKTPAGLLRFMGTAFAAMSVSEIFCRILGMPVKGIVSLIHGAYVPFTQGMGYVGGTAFGYFAWIFQAVVATVIGIALIFVLTKKPAAAENGEGNSANK